MSTTIRSLRADSLQHSIKYERLETKHAEATRKLGVAEGTERAQKQQLRSAEQAAKGLKDEMAKMRILVGQTRASCANEVRKRERVIEGLKKHVGEGGRARGSGKAVGVATITIVAGVGAEENAKPMSVAEAGYDLRSETNEFLTELARGLSEENEGLGALIRRTFTTLKELSGWEREGEQEGGMVVQTDGGLDNVADDMDGVIEHLRTLLTNPSFVPLEEVEVREDEIQRLRDGWEKMEARWREAVQMMDGWRKRMARNGQTVNLDELNEGLKLSPLKDTNLLGFGSTVHTIAEDDEYEEGDTQADIDAMDDSQVPISRDDELDNLESEGESSVFHEEILDEQPSEIADEQEELQTRQEISFTNSSSIGSPPQLSPLREIHPNHNAFTTIIEENTWDLAQLDTSRNSEMENSLILAPSAELSMIKPSPQKAPPSSRSSPEKISSSQLRQPSGSSRLPRPASAAVPQQSPLTMASIAAKLAATEREADAARVRAKLKAAKANAASTKPATVLEPPVRYSTDDKENARSPVKESRETIPTKEEDGPGRKRKAGTRQGGRASRRRSTLSPWELESLIQGGVAVQTPTK